MHDQIYLLENRFFGLVYWVTPFPVASGRELLPIGVCVSEAPAVLEHRLTKIPLPWVRWRSTPPGPWIPHHSIFKIYGDPYNEQDILQVVPTFFLLVAIVFDVNVSETVLIPAAS